MPRIHLSTDTVLANPDGSLVFSASGAGDSTEGATAVFAANSASPITLSAAGNGPGRTIENATDRMLYVLLGTGTVAATLRTVAMATNTYYEVPFGFTGKVSAISEESAAGSIYVTTLAGS